MAVNGEKWICYARQTDGLSRVPGIFRASELAFEGKDPMQRGDDLRNERNMKFGTQKSKNT